MHSAKNLLRRVTDQQQDLMSNDEGSALNEGDVSGFHPDELKKVNSRLDADRENLAHVRNSSQQAKQREVIQG